ncbi:hypothetical protein QVD17_01970 [Tagetes erecta]|uniref:S-protein homolog n=1 Tax=Tagetes erecta TaxID=13708 RepID=A0AAD8L7C5_TARER|nr:hypothetical protein QVD17_01970 [Tagetes erecta]
MGKVVLSHLIIKFIFLFITLNHLQQLVYAADPELMMNMRKGTISNCFMKPVTVYIKSDVNNLRFHCKSKDDDLGEVRRNAGEEYDIHFCLNIWRSTLYFCHFYLGWKQRVMDVFATKNKHDPDYCFSTAYSATVDCYWLIREDGFYVAKFKNPGPNDWLKKFDWE